MKVASLLAVALILCIAFLQSIQPKRRPKLNKYCVGKDGNRYKVGEGYDDNEGIVCIHYKCVKKKKKFIMKKGKCEGKPIYQATLESSDTCDDAGCKNAFNGLGLCVDTASADWVNMSKIIDFSAGTKEGKCSSDCNCNCFKHTGCYSKKCDHYNGICLIPDQEEKRGFFIPEEYEKAFPCDKSLNCHCFIKGYDGVTRSTAAAIEPPTHSTFSSCPPTPECPTTSLSPTNPSTSPSPISPSTSPSPISPTTLPASIYPSTSPASFYPSTSGGSSESIVSDNTSGIHETTQAIKETTSTTTPTTSGILVSARASSHLESSYHCWGLAWCRWGPEFAIDGTLQTTYGKIFHSNTEDYPWIEVELSQSAKVSSITISGRPDCCGETFNNAEIRAGMTRVADGLTGQLLNINTICGRYQGPAATGEQIHIDCASPIMAKFVTIQLKGMGVSLQINEVRINIKGCQEIDIDYYGNDIKHIGNIQNWQTCAMKCKQENGCSHWTWITPEFEGGHHLTCMLKKSGIGRQEKPNLISGPSSCQGSAATATPTIQPTTTPPITIDCFETEVVTKDGFKISSPGYSEAGYEDNQEYCWIFRAGNEKDKLSISITSINTEYGYDIVSIYEKIDSGNKEKVLLTASGDISPGNIISEKNEVRIVFKTDVDIHLKGFEASLMAVKKKDLPHFSWEEFSQGKLNIVFAKDSPHPIVETINIKLAKHFENACIFHGSTKNTNVTLASSYSSSDCKNLGQQAQISIASDFLTQPRGVHGKRATFAIKNGILQETNEETFLDNVILNPMITNSRLRREQAPSHIEIIINLAYDKSILEKFKKYGSVSVESEIKKQIRQIFFFAKSHLEEISGNTQIEIILNEDILFINEIFKVNESSLQYIRKYQTDTFEPFIVICGDFDEFHPENIDDGYVTGLSYRSGACRNDLDQYGVAIVAWRENLATAGDTLAHEIEHMFGMTHHGHTHLDVANWYSKQGHQCYLKECPSPPLRDNGEWICTENNKRCSLKCFAGFATGASIIRCENGQFSSNIDKIACSPSVFVFTGGDYSRHNIEVYHSTNATDRNAPCSNLKPLLKYEWFAHTSIFHEGVLIVCNYQSLCIMLDLEAKDPQWKKHTHHGFMHSPSATVSDNKLYLWSRKKTYAYPFIVDLPIGSTSGHSTDKSLTFHTTDHCFTQIDNNNVALTGGIKDGHVSNDVIVFNIEQHTYSNLSPMITPRSHHACIKVDIGGESWLVVTGGKKTERLSLNESNPWEAMGELAVERFHHQMIKAPKDTILVLGGKWTKSIEALTWGTGIWKLLEESLNKNLWRFSVAEVPSSLLGCHINAETACPDLPQKTHGNWSCNTANNKCTINCDVGYISLFKVTTCIGGIWSEVKDIQCKPIAFIFIYAEVNRFYHPTIGGLTCNKPPPSSPGPLFSHIVFAHKNYVYTCGGFYTKSLCYSLNLDDDEFQWKTHETNISPINNQFNFVILENMLYIIDAGAPPMSTTLPMQEEATFIPVPNFTKRVPGKLNCFIKLNEHSFITLWADGDVSKYDAIQQTETQLPPLIPPRGGLGCVMRTESEKKWIVVSGGIANGVLLNTTERLDLHNDSPKWENMEAPLNIPRYRHMMTMTERGIMAFGAKSSGNPELLNWETKQWSYVEPSVNGNQEFGWVGMESTYFTEVPESKFCCETMALDMTGCDGEYKYNQEYVNVNGIAKTLKDNQTCHSICEKEADCKTWTWNSEDDTCLLQTSMTTRQFKNGSVSGLQGSCKPRCFLLLNNQSALVSTHLCDNKTALTGSEEKCQPMIQMVPEEFKEENTILICYLIEEKRLCEEIDFKDVKQLCNDEPSIVTLSTIKRVNKHRFTTHQRPYFKRYGK